MLPSGTSFRTPQTPRTPRTPRTRRDLCPGVLRPWAADDGALVRLRLVGGRLTSRQLVAVGAVARRYGDGDLHLTGRANLQLRGLPLGPDGARLRPDVVEAVAATGLLPTRTHDLVRNVMVSPQTGLAGGDDGGRADLRAVAAELEALLVADPGLADLPGRFLFVLDDGRGDLLRPCDLGLVALDAAVAQLRVGAAWGRVVPLVSAAAALHDLARRFADARGTGPDAPWHVDELGVRLVAAQPPDPRLPPPAPPLPYGPVAGGVHVAAPGGVVGPLLAADLAARADELVVTPWRGVLVPVPGAAA
ncbi:nitrite reductase [Nocardioides rubriscoriae]|uniref:nitrite reductase n=1 Tax=Nocardioides rubriscoriae TaxID=642762 RepID=UPI0011E051E8|nr:nitrite reductase [Nocardioides rubriscoriae]